MRVGLGVSGPSWSADRAVEHGILDRSLWHGRVPGLELWGGASARTQEGRNTRIEEERGSKEGRGQGERPESSLGAWEHQFRSWIPQENVECGGFPLYLTPHCSLEPHLLLLRCCQK